MQTPEQVEGKERTLPAPHAPGHTGEANSGPGALWLLLAAGVVTAWLSPLADADLPLHLRIGDLLRTSDGWPHLEPVSWTRAGAPWYAYSWLPEWLYAQAWALAGAAGLAGLHAVLTGASILAVWDVAHRDAWSVWGTRLFLGLHLVLWTIVQPATRPQLVLAIAVPMAWGAALRLRDGETLWGAGMALLAAMLAVNSHLLFPLGLAPGLLILAEAKRAPRGALVAFVAATLLGWCATPYLFELPAIFALNFATNALFGAGAAIQEHEPGFRWFTHAPLGMQALTFLMLVLPVLPSSFGQPAGRLRWLTVAWLAGLGLFVLAVRGLLLWWLLAMPLTAAALGSIPLPQRASTMRAVRAAWLFMLAALPLQAWQARMAMSTPGHPLPTPPLPHPEAAALEPVVAWLQCVTAGDVVATAAVGAHATTVFNYGSYLAWRVPSLSWSVDGRTIFPDSVSRAEAEQGRAGSRWHPPYGSAVAVVLPPWHVTGHLLDGDSAFVRVPLSRAGGTPESSTAHLWARRSWMEAVGPKSGRNACGNGA